MIKMQINNKNAVFTDNDQEQSQQVTMAIVNWQGSAILNACIWEFVFYWCGHSFCLWTYFVKIHNQSFMLNVSPLLQYVIRAPKAGVVEAVFYKAGDTVQKGSPLVHLQEDSSSDTSE